MEHILSLVIEPRETKLVKKAIRGNSQAYAELMKLHKTYLYKMAYSYVKDEQKALDLVGECVYLGLININSLRQPQYFKTWITRILITEAMRLLKHETKLTHLEAVNDVQEKTQNVSIETKLDLYDAMDLLRPEYKSVIVLKYFNDMNLEEISELMALPLNTVKSHHRRAKESLKQILKGGI